MKPCEVFAMRLKEYRKAAKLTQKDVSKKTGISCTSLSHWEGSVSKPSAEQLEVLLALYNDRLSELYPEYVPVTILPPLKTCNADKGEAIRKLKQDLEAFNAHAQSLLQILAVPEKLKC
jgi:transcriptional regulator with XRE-family HTH domain